MDLSGLLGDKIDVGFGVLIVFEVPAGAPAFIERSDYFTRTYCRVIHGNAHMAVLLLAWLICTSRSKDNYALRR